MFRLFFLHLLSQPENATVVVYPRCLSVCLYFVQRIQSFGKMFVVDVEQVTCLFATMILSVKTYEMHYDSCLMLYGSSSLYLMWYPGSQDHALAIWGLWITFLCNPLFYFHIPPISQKSKRKNSRICIGYYLVTLLLLMQ